MENKGKTLITVADMLSIKPPQNDNNHRFVELPKLNDDVIGDYSMSATPFTTTEQVFPKVIVREEVADKLYKIHKKSKPFDGSHR
jgi:hypothetical protein